MIRVLIAGASGFVGENLIKRLPSDWQVLALVREGTERPAVRQSVGWIAYEQLKAWRDDGLPTFDAVVDVAGNSNHGLAESDPYLDLVASAGTAALLFSSVRARRAILLSSAAVYAGKTGRVSPEVPVDPAMAYALSKLYAEGLARAYVGKGHFEHLAILRLYNAFGLGERRTRLIPRIAEAVRSGTPFVLSGDPSALSDPISIGDLCEILIRMIVGDGSGTFDVCGGSPTPLRDQVVRISKILGARELEIEERPSPIERPIHFWSDPRPILRAVDVRLSNFDDAVRAYAQDAGWIAD